LVNVYSKIFIFLNTFTPNLSDKNERSLYTFYLNKNISNNVYNILFNQQNVIFDKINFYFVSKKYINSNNTTNLFRSFFRVLNANYGFYLNFLSLKVKKNFLNFLKNTYLSGWKYCWIGIRFWIFSMAVGLSVVYYSMVIRCLPFNKVVFVWICFGMFLYWLLSGFVFFVKKYQFGKYTTVIQRFWRRTYIIFWLIEFSLFIIYLYLTINANQESFYMFDQIQVFKTHLFSWRLFLFKLFPITLLLISSYLFLLSLKWNILNKHLLWLSTISVLLIYTVWTEFYQFFHVINFYGNFNWIYDVDEKIWSLELESRKTRTVNHYVMLMSILKFWHIVFIFGFWIFFVLRSLEIGRIRYPIFSANLQNFIILYLFAWVNMYPWLKFILRKYMDMPYYWFYVNNRRLGVRVFFNDIKLFYLSILDYFSYSYNLIVFCKNNFFYWKLSNYENSCVSFRKVILKNLIISHLN